MKYKYTKEQVQDAIKTSYSYASVLSKLGIIPAGGNYQTVKKLIKKFNLDISHFTHQGWNKGQIFGPKRPIEDYLNNKQSIYSYKLAKRLIKEKFFEHKCCSCLLTKWLGESIPVELHHIDGNRDNNNLENLQLLCPNCHSLTPNYRGKKLKKIKFAITSTHKIKNKWNKEIKEKIVKRCSDCNKPISEHATRCKSCVAKLQGTKIVWPSIEEIERMLQESSFVAVGKKLGVSDNAVRKHLRTHKIPGVGIEPTSPFGQEIFLPL